MNEPFLAKRDLEKVNIKKQRKILIIATVLVISLFIGTSYSLLTSTKETEEVITVKTGNLNMEITSTGINLGEELPKNDIDGLNNQSTMITLENIGTVDIGRYEVKLEKASNKESTLDEQYIRYAISEDDKTYSEGQNLKTSNNIIYKGYNLKSNKSKNIYLKLWLDESAGEEILSKSYFGSVTVELYQDGDKITDLVKSNLVPYSESSKSEFSGGVVAVNTNGLLYNEDSKETIREYRYSGVNVNNYVKFNNEDWRILGVFKDDNGIEQVKIVRNELLNNVFPDSFTVDDTTYKIKYNSSFAYWNAKNEGTVNNDWENSGLQHWLNSSNDKNQNLGYLHYIALEYINMIESNKFYLGTVTNKYTDESNYGIVDTPKEAYINERDVKSCENNLGKDKAEKGCLVWNGNRAIWTGKIGLIYPSDYGYTSNSEFWNVSLSRGSFNGNPANSSWLVQNANHTSGEWLLSPSSGSSLGVSRWGGGSDLYDGSVQDNVVGVRPTLYLKSDVKITSGDGSKTNPYILTL